MRTTTITTVLIAIAGVGFGLACAESTVAGGSRRDAAAEAGSGGQGGQGGGGSGGAGGGAVPSDAGGAGGAVDAKPADTGGAGAGGVGGSAGAGGAGGSGAAGGAGGGGPGGDPGAPPSCTGGTTPGPDEYPTTREEMFCYVNSQRGDYASHSRSECCGTFGGCGGKGISWPYKMTWDGGLSAEAQVEAARVAAGGKPKGPPYLMGSRVSVEGCESYPGKEMRADATRYMVTAVGDPPDGVDACDLSCDSMHMLSYQVGFNRLAIYYFDPGGAKPRMSKLGIGMALQADGNRTWVLNFGP